MKQFEVWHPRCVYQITIWYTRQSKHKDRYICTLSHLCYKYIYSCVLTTLYTILYNETVPELGLSLLRFMIIIFNKD